MRIIRGGFNFGGCRGHRRRSPVVLSIWFVPGPQEKNSVSWDRLHSCWVWAGVSVLSLLVLDLVAITLFDLALVPVMPHLYTAHVK